MGSELVCLDTDIIVGLLKGDKEAVGAIDRLQDEGEYLKTTVINAYELLKGAAISSRPEENQASVRDLLSSVAVLPLNCESCEEASKIYGKLRKAGQIAGEFDILIASIVIFNGEALISRDGHFKLMEDLILQTS